MRRPQQHIYEVVEIIPGQKVIMKVRANGMHIVIFYTYWRLQKEGLILVRPNFDL
jgi:hypothetical protein